MFPREDLEQRITLGSVPTFIDDCLHGSVAFVERSRKRDHHKKAEPIERHVAEMATIDPHPEQTLAIAVGGSGIEVAGTAKGTVTVLDPIALQPPFGTLHGSLPEVQVVIGQRSAEPQQKRTLFHG